MTPSDRQVSRNLRGSFDQSSKAAGTAKPATELMRSSRAARQNATAPPALNPATPTSTTLRVFVNQSTATPRSSIQPRNEKSPAERPQPRNVKVSTAEPVSSATNSASSA